MGVPYTFGTATTSIPLSNLDANFNTPVTIGSTTVGLGNTVTTVANLTLTNATISSGNVTVTTGIFGAGSNTAPAITTTGDTNTGIFFPAADTIAFTEGGVESMRIDSSGNVGIGTSSPTQNLQVAGTTKIGVTGTNGVLQLARTSDGATITNFKTDGTSGIIDSAVSTIFQINTAEVMRIDSSGNLLVGTTSVVGVSKQSISVNGAVNWGIGINDANSVNSAAFLVFQAGGTTIGSITNNNSTGVLYNITSDYRLKNVISPVADSGQRIDALQPIEYDWKVNGGRTRGFLAHQFAEVYPNSVSGEKDAIDKEGKPKYQSMQAATSEVMADLIAEIQSLRKRVAQLESK